MSRCFARTQMEDRAIITNITKKLESALVTWYGQGAILRSRHPSLRTYPVSFFLVYEICAQGKTYGILVKIPRKREMQTLDEAIAASHTPEGAARLPDTQHEFAMLHAVQAMVKTMDTALFDAVRPLAYWSQWNALVMEELPSVSLETLVGRRAMRWGAQGAWKQFETIMARAGVWLRHFHDTEGEITPVLFDSEAFSARIARKLSQFPDPVRVMHLQGVFDAVVHPLEGSMAQKAQVHNDFYLRNIVWTNMDKVAVFDLDRQVDDLVFHDLAMFITELIGQRAKLLKLGFLLPLHRLDASVDAFLHAYFGTDDAYPPFLYLYNALGYLTWWQWYEARFASTSRIQRVITWLPQIWLRNFFSQELTRALARAQSLLVASTQVRGRNA